MDHIENGMYGTYGSSTDTQKFTDTLGPLGKEEGI